MKKTFFYFDDVIWLFRDLTRNHYDSVFDHFYLKYLKEAHDRYGMKVQVNVFYRTDYYYGTDEFTLADMTDKYKAEWESASDWLRFGFHSRQEFPDYPLVNSSYEDVIRDFKSIKDEVVRFAGEKTFSNVVCSHWRPISKAGCKALADCGIKIINCTSGPTREYTGDSNSLPIWHIGRLLQNRQPETKIFTRKSLNPIITNSICGYNHLTPEQGEETLFNDKFIFDEYTGVYFKQLLTHGTLINLSTMEGMEEEYKELIECDFASFGGHEQYFYPDYYGYQPDHGEKLLKSCEILTKNGFEFVFADEMLK